MTSGRKRNVPPFQGGTWEHFRPKAVSVNAVRQGFSRECKARAIPVQWKNNRLQCLDAGTCGLWARTLARESLRIVAFFLSGTTSRATVLIPRVLVVLRNRPGAIFALGEG